MGFFKDNLLHSVINKKCLSLLQDWGKPGDLWNLDIQWHVPSSEEINFAFYLLDTFLQPELTRLEHYATGKLEMSRLVGMGNVQQVPVPTRVWFK